MGAMWVSEPLLRVALGDVDARALLDVLGGMTFYVPKDPGPTKTFGHNLEHVLSRKGFAALCRLAGGETVCLPSARRVTGRKKIRSLLEQGRSHREIAEALRVSVRYVEMIAALPRQARQLRMF